MTMSAGEFRLEPAIGSIVGGREEQQDAARAETFEAQGVPAWLLIVADGMGGHAGGRVASRIAVDTYCSSFLAEDALALPDRLHKALRAANRAIAAAARESRELRDMGCTIVAATLVEDCLHWISVGDSLLLAIRDGQVVRLNADHSMAPEIDRAAREGRMSRDEADHHPDRNVLLAAVNGAPLKLVDEGMRRISKGTLVLLVTDGVLSLTGDQLAAAASDGKTASAIVGDVLSAIERDMQADQDNTTLVAMRYQAERPVAAPGRRRRTLGAACLLASLGGAFWVGLILKGNIAREALPDQGDQGARRASSPPAEPANPRRVDRPVDRIHPIAAARAGGSPPTRAPKKPAHGLEERPHFSLAAPGTRARTTPGR